MKILITGSVCTGTNHFSKWLPYGKTKAFWYTNKVKEKGVSSINNREVTNGGVK